MARRRRISEGHVMDIAIAIVRDSGPRNPALIEDLEKIAAECKGRDRAFDAHQERERVTAQRALWAALPEFGPGGEAADALKAAIIARAWRLLDSGQCEACEALLEFVPEADARQMLNEYFGEWG
jgi:hypothetical protein